MPHPKPKGKPDLTADQWAQYDQLRADGLSLTKAAAAMGLSQATLSRRVEARAHPSNGTPTTALQRIEIVGAPVSAHDSADLKAQIDVLATQVKDLQAHRLEIDAWIATLQAQSRDTVQPRAEVRSTELRSLAQSSAESAQTWDDPDDAKSVPFNLSLPRGLKRLLDAEAKRTGLPASRLVQRLLMAALTGEGAHDA
jgi:hypothetical protein